MWLDFWEWHEIIKCDLLRLMEILWPVSGDCRYRSPFLEDFLELSTTNSQISLEECLKKLFLERALN